MKILILFLLSSVFMYAAFFSYHTINDIFWVWAKIPTVIVFTSLSIAHLFLIIANLLGGKDAKK